MNRRALVAAAGAVLAAILVFVFVGIGRDATTTSEQQSEVLTDLAELADSAQAPGTVNDTANESLAAALDETATIDPPSPDAQDDFPAIVDSAVKDPDLRLEPAAASFEILEVIPHDTGAFTQGLEIFDDRLFESTGLVGQSSIRELDLDSGAVLRNTAVDNVFAEGLTILGDTAIQLTWQDGVAFRYDTETFEQTETYTYEGEGWGLCHDDEQLVMSDGSPTLQFRDPGTFELRSTVDVTFAGVPVDELNELECVDGTVWANIWRSSLIVEIDPGTGAVLTVLNAATLTPPEVAGSSSAVLNGIAFDPTDGTFLLTGKLWPSIYRVRLTIDE